MPVNADGGAIKKAFRKGALQWHPDKHKGEEAQQIAEKEFRELGEAYEVLSDEEKRGKYDRGEDLTPQPQQQQRQHFNFGGQSFNFNFGGR